MQNTNNSNRLTYDSSVVKLRRHTLAHATMASAMFVSATAIIQNMLMSTTAIDADAPNFELSSMLVDIFSILAGFLIAILLSEIISIILRTPVSLSIGSFSLAYHGCYRPQAYWFTEDYILPYATKRKGEIVLHFSLTSDELAKLNAARGLRYIATLPKSRYPIGIGYTPRIELSARLLAKILREIHPGESVVFVQEVLLSSSKESSTRQWPMISFRETSYLLRFMYLNQSDAINVAIGYDTLGSPRYATLTKDELFDYECRIKFEREYIYLDRREF